jgi:hypothetical protein
MGETQPIVVQNAPDDFLPYIIPTFPVMAGESGVTEIK